MTPVAHVSEISETFKTRQGQMPYYTWAEPNDSMGRLK